MINKSWSNLLLASGLFGIAAALLYFFFQSLPVDGSSLGLDWQGIWLGLRGGLPRYGTGLRNPPWSLIPVFPLGLLSFRSSWAILTLATIGIEVIAVPRELTKRVYLLVTIFLVTSYPSLRTIADGNVEVLPIAGVLLTLFGYRTRRPWLMAIGLLVASAKPQETWLLIVILALFVLRTWPLKRILPAALGISVVLAVSMILIGREWIDALIGIEARGSIMDMSLLSSLARLRLPPIVIWGIWITIFCITLYVTFATGSFVDHRKAGLLITASLLLAPYAAGNNLLVVASIGVMPLFISDLKTALALAILIDLPYLMLGQISVVFWYGAYYGTVTLLLMWCVFAWKTRGSTEYGLPA
ncbi:MAG: DUF2029 domain-containing protein [Anaerolineales bacterium]|nr:MAG: DUF2029 domain-containing protein [Anaerolineales bacterium]